MPRRGSPGQLLLEIGNADRQAVLFVPMISKTAIALADTRRDHGGGTRRGIIGDGGCRYRGRADISEVRMERNSLTHGKWECLKDEVLKGYAQSGRGEACLDPDAVEGQFVEQQNSREMSCLRGSLWPGALALMALFGVQSARASVLPVSYRLQGRRNGRDKISPHTHGPNPNCVGENISPDLSWANPRRDPRVRRSWYLIEGRSTMGRLRLLGSLWHWPRSRRCRGRWLSNLARNNMSAVQTHGENVGIFWPSRRRVRASFVSAWSQPISSGALQLA